MLDRLELDRMLFSSTFKKTSKTLPPVTSRFAVTVFHKLFFLVVVVVPCGVCWFLLVSSDLW